MKTVILQYEGNIGDIGMTATCSSRTFTLQKGTHPVQL